MFSYRTIHAIRIVYYRGAIVSSALSKLSGIPRQSLSKRLSRAVESSILRVDRFPISPNSKVMQNKYRAGRACKKFLIDNSGHHRSSITGSISEKVMRFVNDNGGTITSPELQDFMGCDYIESSQHINNIVKSKKLALTGERSPVPGYRCTYKVYAITDDKGEPISNRYLAKVAGLPVAGIVDVNLPGLDAKLVEVARMA